jgi:hypothetical protein
MVSALSLNPGIIVDSKVSINGDVKNHESPARLSLASASLHYAAFKDLSKEQQITCAKQTVLNKPIATNSATGI